jgi:hypothetical protein
VVGCCEYGNEHSSSMKDGDFFLTLGLCFMEVMNNMYSFCNSNQCIYETDLETSRTVS